MSWRSTLKTPIGDDYTVADARAARFLWPAGWVALLGILGAATVVGASGEAWLMGLLLLSGAAFPTQLVLLKLHKVRSAVTLYALTFLTVSAVGLWFTGGTSGPFSGAMLFPLIGVAVAGSPRALKICVVVGSLLILGSIPATREIDGFPVHLSALLALLVSRRQGCSWRSASAGTARRSGAAKNNAKSSSNRCGTRRSSRPPAPSCSVTTSSTMCLRR